MPCNPVEDNKKITKGPELGYKPKESLGKHILDKLKENGDEVADIYVPTEEELTFAQLKEQSIRVALEMRRLGIKQGDVISICAFNHPNATLPFFGALYLGAVIAPLVPVVHISDLKNLLNIIRPKIIFSEKSSVETLENAAKLINLTVDIVVFGEPELNHQIPFSNFLVQKDSKAEEEFEPIDFENPYDHLACIMLSSGTTGAPKGVSVSHGSILQGIQTFAIPPIPKMTMVTTSSLFWMTGVIILVLATDRKIKRVSLPHFECEPVMDAIQKYKPFGNIITLANLATMINHPRVEEYDFSFVRTLTIIGAKATENHIIAAKKLYKTAIITSGYGLTESAGGIFDAESSNLNSIGRPVAGIEVKIVNPETKEILGPNETGELYIRGGVIMSGYYNDPKLTAESLDEEKWLHTGDLCYYDENKDFYIVGRLKEQFKCKVWHVLPQELEDTLVKHPDIIQAAVVPVPHPLDVNRAKAFIVKRNGSRLTEDDVQTFMKERLSPYKQLLGGVCFLDTLPTSHTGKIMKKVLKEMAIEMETS